MRGRKLGRNASHRRAMFRNMAASLIKSVRTDDDAPNKPKVPGRIVTTVPKAKELRPFVEQLITLARKALPRQEPAEAFATRAERNSAEWKQWRESSQWQKWNQTIAPALAYRRRAFAQLRDIEAVDILFSDLAEHFADRPGGYTRVIELARVRLGDAANGARRIRGRAIGPEENGPHRKWSVSRKQQRTPRPEASPWKGGSVVDQEHASDASAGD